MSTPAPRPALRKAPDAHIHPAAPGHAPGALRLATSAAAATDEAVATVPAPATSPEASPAPARGTAPGTGHRLSGPLGGTTSDSLRAAARAASGRRRGSGREKPKEKLVPLDVKVPKDLRKQLRDAARAAKQDPDVLVTALLRAWLQG